MKRKWKKIKPVLAMFIAVVMMLEPLGSGLSVYAAEDGAGDGRRRYRGGVCPD